MNKAPKLNSFSIFSLWFTGFLLLTFSYIWPMSGSLELVHNKQLILRAISQGLWLAAFIVLIWHFIKLVSYYERRRRLQDTHIIALETYLLLTNPERYMVEASEDIRMFNLMQIVDSDMLKTYLEDWSKNERSRSNPKSNRRTKKTTK